MQPAGAATAESWTHSSPPPFLALSWLPHPLGSSVSVCTASELYSRTHIRYGVHYLLYIPLSTYRLIKPDHLKTPPLLLWENDNIQHVYTKQDPHMQHQMHKLQHHKIPRGVATMWFVWPISLYLMLICSRVQHCQLELECGKAKT